MLARFSGSPHAGVPDTSWLKGYQRSLTGWTIDYHSPYPDTTSALLVRATDGRMSIEWESQPVPVAFDQPFATFLWMAGLATQKGAHAFSLLVNDDPLLTFHTGKDGSERTWEITARDGASLRFKTTMVDQFNELFGFMWLRLPRARIKPGEPVRFKVAGEKGGSSDWFMVFEDTLASGITVTGEQALIRKGGRLLQLVRVEISHIAPPGSASVAAGLGDSPEPLRIPLETGYNALYLPIPAVTRDTPCPISVEIEGQPAHRETITLRPVEKREIYLLPHSHVDIGYSDRQEVVEKNHWRYFEEAIELARRTQDYPPEARFKWNVEVLWAVETYLRQATPEKREAFIDAVRKGWIGLQALPANELTGLCHPEELFRALEFARRLERDDGLSIHSAMITDIPGYSWSVVPVLAQSGVKYVSSGPNYMPNLPDGGDRIGHVLQAWGDKPFYWISPSGQERVLLWLAGHGYSWFHGLHMGPLTKERKRPLFDYMRALADAGYPYAMVQVRYTIGGDNGPPDPDLSDVVKTWNGEFESPRLVIATSGQMFEEFERRYGRVLPEVRGDFTPYWEDGAASTARETALNRGTAEKLLQAETLWAMLAPGGFPADEFYEAWRQVVLFEEHTWGAAESIHNPDSENARAQWAWKEALALEGRRRAEGLVDSLRRRVSGSSTQGRQAIDVLNTSSWPRTDIVRLPGDLSGVGDRVGDEAGQSVPSQRLSTGELAILVRDVPPFASRRYFIEPGAPFHEGAARADAGHGVVEDDRLQVAIDPQTGAISSLTWNGRPGVDLVDRTRGSGLNEYLYVRGRTPDKPGGVGAVKVSVKEPGPLVASLMIESDAPGCRRLAREVRLGGGCGYFDIIDLLDKEKVRDKESVHIGFPFRVPGGTVRLDLGWASIRPEVDQIPGSCRDYFCVQNAADVSNHDYGITLVSLDVPLVEVGAITDESPVSKGLRAWRTRIEPTQTLFSYAMNNYWHTNYKADQEGLVELRYALRPHEGSDPAAAKRFAMERGQPLVAMPAVEHTTPLGSLLDIEPSGVIVTSFKPSRDGKAWIVRLYNAGEARELAAVGGPICRPGAVHRSNPFEDNLDAVDGPLSLLPHEIVTLRIERGQ